MDDLLILLISPAISCNMRKGHKSPNKYIWITVMRKHVGENRSMKWKAPSFIKKGEEMVSRVKKKTPLKNKHGNEVKY